MNRRTKRDISILDGKLDAESDINLIVQDALNSVAIELSHNPRELKRFANLFRFYYFLLLAKAHGNPKFRYDENQLIRWIILTLKWPDMIRWLLWGSYHFIYENDQLLESKKQSNPDPASFSERVSLRLRYLEEAGARSKNQNEWEKELFFKFGLRDAQVSWVKDEGLRMFFREEGNRLPESTRLSKAIDKGIY